MDDWDSVATFDGGASTSDWGDVASFDEPAGDDWAGVADFTEAPAPQQEAQPTPPPADDWYQKMYQDVTAKEAEANVQGINTYDYNLGLASSMAPQGNPLTRTVGGAMRAAGDAVINPMLAAESVLGWDAAGELLASRQAQGDIEDAKQTSWLEKTVSGVANSLAQAGTLAATGGLPAILAGFGVNSYNDSHRQAIKEGKTEEEAAKIARANAAIEVGVMGAFQAVGLGGLESSILKGAKWAGVKKFVTQTAAELTEEELTTLGQQLASKGEVGDPQAYADTAVQTIATMGLVGAYQKARTSEKVRAFLERPSRSTAKALGLDGIATTQKQRQELAKSVAAEVQAEVPAEVQPTTEGEPNEEQTLQSEEAPQAEGQVDDRFRGLANQTAIPEARAANYEVDVEMGYPDRQSWKDAEDRVAQRIQAEPDAALSEALGKIDEAERTGGTVDLRTMDDAALFNRLKEQAALDISNPEQRALHRKLHIAFRTSRTEQARSLGYRDPVTAANPEARARKALTDAIADPTPEEYEALKGARTPEERAAIDEKMEERYQREREELAAEGIDLDDLDSILADPKKTLYVLDKLRPDASKWDIAYEYWRNAILSGPLTQSTNIIGNTLFSAWNLGPERAVEAAINLFVRDPKSAQLGEFKYLLGGIMPGLKRGLRNATRAWQLETSSLADELGREGAFKIEGPRGAIKGKLGRLVRAMGYRPLLAADEFAKSLTATMEVGAHAYRDAKAQGLQGQELQEFITSQTEDFASPAWDAAFSKAEEMAFQGKHGLVAKNLSSGGNKLRRIRGIRWIVPFVDTPASIMEEGLKRTPIFGAMLDYAEARKKGNNIVDAGMTPTLARQFIAMSVFAMLWDAVGGDDPWITGAAGLSERHSRDASYRAAPPMSIKLFGNWWSYARIEPFATSLAWTVDTIDGIKKGQPVSQLLFGTAQQLKNKSYLDGIGEVMDMIEGTASGDPAAVEEYIGKMAASVVPNFWRQGVRALDGEMSESRVWGKELELTQRIATRTLQQAGVPGVPKTQRYDLWGRPIRYNDSWGSTAADFAWNLLSPVKVKDLDSVTQADLALLRWNSKNPNDRLVWNEPNKYVEFQGKTRYLTDQQYEEYAKLSGELAIRAVSTMNINAANPTKRLIESIGKKVGRAREMARKRLLPKWKQEWGK